jgi:hypothetical protein
VFAQFDGRKASLPTVYSGKDLMQTAGRVVQLSKDVDRISIDDAGLGGVSGSATLIAAGMYGMASTGHVMRRRKSYGGQRRR